MYTGQNVPPGEHGLTHDLVMRLMQPYVGQGYRLFTDNYYTSHALAESLIASNTDLVGTVRSNRHGSGGSRQRRERRALPPPKKKLKKIKKN